jgi:hypothetical protein
MLQFRRGSSEPGSLEAIPYMIGAAAGGAFAISNIGSLVEGKGLRIGGGLLDTGLLLGYSLAVINLSIDDLLLPENADENTKSAVRSAAFVAMYAGTKYIIGSPTSMLTNALVAGSFAAGTTLFFE